MNFYQKCKNSFSAAQIEKTRINTLQKNGEKAFINFTFSDKEKTMVELTGSESNKIFGSERPWVAL